jgi:cell division protein ZapA (FtsZ GTPase activity inhibitor)
MSPSQSSVVTVNIAGESYTLRAHATPEYTRECAEYLDDMIRQIQQQTGKLDPHRVAILAGLALADQLMQSKNQGSAFRTETLKTVRQLNAEIEAQLARPDLAATS